MQCPRRSFCGTCLQEEQLAVLHCKLDVLDVAEFAFQESGTVGEFSCHLWKPSREQIGIAGHSPAGDHVLALSIKEKIYIELLRTGCRISQECDTGARSSASIAKDHRLNGDGSALDPVKFVETAVFLCPRALPGAINGAENVEGESDLDFGSF